MERRKSGHNRINVAYRSNNGIRYEHLDISIIIPLCGFIRRSNDLRGKCLLPDRRPAVGRMWSRRKELYP